MINPATDAMDSDLLKAFVDDCDDRAFESLVTRYRGLAYTVSRRYLRGGSDMVEDAVQAVFILLSRKAESLVGRRDISGWIHHTSVNVSRALLRSELRRRQRHERAAIEEEQKAVYGEVAGGNTAEIDMQQVHQAIAALPSELSCVVVAHYFRNQSCAAIAAGSGCSQNAVRMRLFRARRKLKKKLEKKGTALSLAVLTALLENEAEAVQESCVRSQLSVGEASETAKSLADSVLREMGRQGVLKVAGIVAAGLVLAGGIGAAVSFSGPSFRSLRSFGSLEPATQWRVASVTGPVEGVEVGQALCPGDVIRTGPGQEVELRSEAGGRVLLREEGELGLREYPISNKEYPMSKLGRRTLRVPRSAFRVRKGAVVAELKGPARFETEHGVVESAADGADFWLMVADVSGRSGGSEGAKTESTNAFTRVDLTNGTAQLLPTHKPTNSQTPTHLTPGEAVSLFADAEPVRMPSDGREFSPKYGGIFFRRVALGYARGEWGLDRSTEGQGEPRRIPAESLVEDVQYFDRVRRSVVTPAPSPDYTVRAEDETIRILERSGAGAHIDAYYSFGDVASWPGVQVDFEICIRKRFAEKHDYVWFSGGSPLTVADVGLAVLEQSFDRRHNVMSRNRWYGGLETRLLVGRLPDQRPVYERQVQMSWMPKPEREFIAVGVSRIGFSVRECEIGIRNITIRRRKHVDVREATSGKQTEEDGV